MIKFSLLNILLVSISLSSFGQNCNTTDAQENCKFVLSKNYNVYLQHKNTEVSVNDTLRYNISFTGNRDYILSVCTGRKYYPISIRLLKPGSGMVLYNNVTNFYNESVSMGLYNSQNIILEVYIMAGAMPKERKNIKELVCVGLDMQCKKIFSDQE